MTGVMKLMKRLTIYILTICMAFAMLFSLASCEKESEDDFLIAYTNSTNDDVEYYRYPMNDKAAKSGAEIVNELISQLFTEDREDGVHYSPLPAEVQLNSVTIDDGVVSLDFSEEYANLSNVQELILKACVVITLAQLDDVNSIRFTINGSPITDIDGNEVGEMNPSQYVDILLSDEELLKQETSLEIYFTDEAGSGLKAYNYNFTLDNQTQSLEEYIVRKLIEGPDESDAYATLDPSVELISIMTTDNTCYVNFAPGFLEQNQTVSDDIMIYSIVNSLTDLAYISNVQFLVDGESDIRLHKTFDLSKSLTRRADLILE